MLIVILMSIMEVELEILLLAVKMVVSIYIMHRSNPFILFVKQLF